MAETKENLLSVETLAQIVFCARAGVIAHELSLEEESEEVAQHFNLDYAPRFHLAGIEEALNRLTTSLARWGWAGAATLVAAGLAFVIGFQLVLIPLGFALMVISWIAAKRINRIVELSDWRGAARDAVPKEPGPTAEQHQRINWWEVLAAGFDSISAREPYRDDERVLKGKPWRVLRKGSLRIPVIRASNNEQQGAPLPHHAIQVAAYCRLLRVCEGFESPYAILLFGDSWEGLAVADTEVLQTSLGDAVKVGAELLADAKSHDPPAPRDRLVCAACRFGRPVVYRVERGSPWWADNGRVHGVPKNGRTFHSCCGDRFDWTPPHAKAERLKLTE